MLLVSRHLKGVKWLEKLRRVRGGENAVASVITQGTFQSLFWASTSEAASGGDCWEGLPIVKRVLALTYWNRSSNHSLKGLLLRKTHLFIHKEKGQVRGLQCREKMYVYCRAGEKSIKVTWNTDYISEGFTRSFLWEKWIPFWWTTQGVKIVSRPINITL